MDLYCSAMASSSPSPPPSSQKKSKFFFQEMKSRFGAFHVYFQPVSPARTAWFLPLFPAENVDQFFLQFLIVFVFVFVFVFLFSLFCLDVILIVFKLAGIWPIPNSGYLKQSFSYDGNSIMSQNNTFVFFQIVSIYNAIYLL